MGSTEGLFDLNRLSRAIDEARADRQVTLAAVSREVGVATSTIRRFASASDAEADGVLALVGSLGVPPEQFVVDSKVAGVPLPPPGDGVIRVDMAALRALAAQPPQARLRTRTTIQRLVSAAQASRVHVATLTRPSLI